ncbi:MAG TPA: ATP-binding cassette domain-containing protein, partial [Burkholderiaceae bacterium]|nr:ATP-binding cassette domain-containing protein [Burkholderiaceae bacterium]
ATIMGHTTFHSGDIRFNSSGIQTKPVYERNRIGIGYVPQERMIFPSLSVHENLDVARRPGRWTVDGVYDLFPRLKERRTAMGNQLSGGEQQMLAIGRALMGNPSLLLMDEPLEGLAPIIVEELLRSIARVVRDEGMSAIIVEQNPRSILPITQRAIVLDRGSVVHEGASDELMADRERLDRWLAVAKH